MPDIETVVERLRETRKYLEGKEWSDEMASPHITNIIYAIELLKEQQETIELQGSLLTLAHVAMNQKRKKDKD